jgi:hypothetical protein
VETQEKVVILEGPVLSVLTKMQITDQLSFW